MIKIGYIMDRNIWSIKLKGDIKAKNILSNKTQRKFHGLKHVKSSVNLTCSAVVSPLMKSKEYTQFTQQISFENKHKICA